MASIVNSTASWLGLSLAAEADSWREILRLLTRCKTGVRCRFSRAVTTAARVPLACTVYLRTVWPVFLGAFGAAGAAGPDLGLTGCGGGVTAKLVSPLLGRMVSR